jgi:dTDP-4-dehydrorhamnose reductase
MNNKILLTGGSGLLGKELQKYINCYAPSHKELDIKKPIQEDINVHVVIHCAAYTDVAKAEKEKEECFKTNVIGTKNLVNAFPNAYFVYISSEYVKNSVNFYSHTKKMGEDIVLKKPYGDILIIRTLFKPRPFPYEYAFFDQWTTGDYVDVIAPIIVTHILNHERGIIDVGTGRKTMFQLAHQTKPNIKGISVDDVKDVLLPKDYQ